MVDASWESPLHEHAGKQIAGAGLAIVERPFRTMFNVRGDPRNAAFVPAFAEATGLMLPEANAFVALDGRLVAWLGPDELLLILEAGDAVADASQTRQRLNERIPTFTEIGAGYATLEISGSHSRSVLARACALDLHPRALIAGQCLQTQMAGTAVLLLLRDDSPRFELVVRRSFADHLWRWLERSAQY